MAAWVKVGAFGWVATKSTFSARERVVMDLISTDVVIIGAGGAGLRAAVAVAESDPSLKVALVSKVYPMRSHTVAAEGGAAGVIKASDSLDYHFYDTVAGGDWLCDQDAVDVFV
jgi:fumarate reductase flavoprotein subunit